MLKKCCFCKNMLLYTSFYKNQNRCKNCHKLWMRHYRKTLLGFLDQKYTAMSKRVRGKDKNCIKTVAGLPIVSMEEFYLWCSTQQNLLPLFYRYMMSRWDFKLCPTIDRIDTKKGYIINNMRFLTQSENSQRNKGIKKGPWKNK